MTASICSRAVSIARRPPVDQHEHRGTLVTASSSSAPGSFSCLMTLAGSARGSRLVIAGQLAAQVDARARQR